LREMCYGFYIGAASARLLTRFVPVVDRLLVETRLRAVMCQDLGFGFGDVGQICLNNLCGLPVQLSLCPFKERLIGCILDQRVLERIRRLWWHPLLIEQFRCYQTA
jgi:hypothetical protein